MGEITKERDGFYEAMGENPEIVVVEANAQPSKAVFIQSVRQGNTMGVVEKTMWERERNRALLFLRQSSLFSSGQ